MDVRLTLKAFGWFYATFISMMFVFFFMDVCYGLGPLLSGLARQFTPLILVLFIVFFTVPILFFRLFILPIYRLDYDDSGFLASAPKQVLLYLFAALTFMGLALPLFTTAIKPL
jgi:hypothetical protein